MIRLSTGSFLRRTLPYEKLRNACPVISKRYNHNVKQNMNAIPAFSQLVKENDDHLRLIFDDKQLWKQFSLKTNIDPVGLCGHPDFSDVHGIQFATQQAIQRSQILVERICNASTNGSEEMRKVVKNLDRLSDTLCSVIDLAEFVRNAHPDNSIQDSVHQAYSDLCSYMNTLNTDTRIHKILSEVLADSQLIKYMDEEEYKSAMVLLHDFEKSGIHLPSKKREEFIHLSDLIIHLGRNFIQQNPRAIDTVKIPVSELAGIPIHQTHVKNGFAYIPTDSPQAQTILKYAKNEQVRKQVYQSIYSATEESINTLESLMKTRAQLATLVGNSSFAELHLQDKMAKNPGNVDTFLRTLLKHQEPLFRKDMNLLQSSKQCELKNNTTSTIFAWDRDYYMHLCNQIEFEKHQKPMPYFTVGSVIQGLSRLFNHLYGVRFEYSSMRPGESWNDEVRKLDVVCEDEGKIGTIYCDLFMRQGKTAHAAHYTIRTSRRVDDDDDHNDVRFAFPGRNVDESRLFPPITQPAERIRGKDGLYQLPIIALTCDFAQGTGNQPSFLSMYDVETLFHEMGHAMHSMLGRTDFHNVAGTRCASDFVELPSVLMEHFVSHPEVMSLFTNETVSSPQVGHKQGKLFNGIELNAQILMALVDQSYHSSLANSDSFSSVKEWYRLQDSVGLFPSVPETMWPVQFNHLFGYASNYYSYLLDRTLARRVWETNFKENPLSRVKGQAFREGVLKWGGSRDPWECIASVLSEEDASKIIKGDEEAMKTVGDWGVDIFLGYSPTLEVSTWPTIYFEERQRYTDLRREHIEEPAEKMNKKEEEDLLDNNPLALSETNPWQQYFADSEIRKVIRQDVERTFPDVDFFRSNEIQQHLTDILFIYCKLNRDTSYRQGMHELLAPLYWVLATDSLDISDMDQSIMDPATKVMVQVLDSAYVEHDAYILFNNLMKHGKPWYEFNEGSANKAKTDTLPENIPKPSESARLNPVVMICHRIHHQYLHTVDPLLYKHLQDFGIEPQLYGLRWIRLLFGREFDIYELLKLWDAIFAQDPTFEIVEYVCVVMLLRMRDQLLQRDYAECLSMLMRPPQISKPATLVEQAKYLQDSLSQDAALHILQQNDIRSGKEPRSSLYDGVIIKNPTAADQQRGQRTFQHRNSHGSNLDSSLSRITNNMMKNPQFRDFNKAIAGVMESFQSNANNIGDNTGGSRRPTFSDFPSSIDRIIPKSNIRHDRNSASSKGTKYQDSAAKLVAMNKQMGELVADCISMLEKEIFPPLQPETVAQKQIPEQEVPTENIEEKPLDDVEADNLVKAEKQAKLIQCEEPEKHYGVKNEANVVMALAGLKHVRDVLLGKQLQFDASVMRINNPEDSNDLDWHLVEQRDIETFPAEQAKPLHQNDKKINYEKDKPLPPLKKQSSILFESKLPQVPVTYVPANPTPPKPTIKYRIEDLLSDPELQSPASKASASAKLKLILSNEENTQTSQSTPQDVFRSSSRKRSSYNISKALPVAEGENTVDPLDAKNVDNRKTYEFDLI
ncbi:hypothetical protein G6F36_008317 [Rhizopus arrhizus]|nr:hypothetical protein G6F36_008317 [Rhizopus arrhizus]